MLKILFPYFNSKKMKRIYFMLLIFCYLGIQSCKTNAITGRNQLNLISDAQLQAMALTEYQQFLSKQKVVNSSADSNAKMVQRVGKRITNAITKYYTEQHLTTELKGFAWEYNLVNSNEMNAWCMPGGKIVVYTGLLPITKNEDALAVVMGHEIAHALAKHGNERLSRALIQQFGNAALSVAISNKPKETQELFLKVYGVGTTVGLILPYSRMNELEADKFGLRFAALAGYNVREAIPLWKRMQLANGNSGSVAFLNTHPTEENRIQELSNIMEETIKKYYQPYH